MKQITILTKHVCALAVLLACAVTATAADFEVDDISYNVIGDNQVEVTKRDSVKYVGEVYIPSSVTYEGVTYQVTRIGNSAFSYSYDLTLVEIPEGVTEIGRNAFSSCRNLESIEMPNSLVSIGEYAFSHSGITNFYIPRNVSHLEIDAFYACSKLASYMCSGLNAYYKTLNGVLYNKDMTTLLAYPTAARATTFDIPGTVTAIGEDGMGYNSYLVEVNIPESVVWVGNSAFRNCDALESLVFPDGITHMGYSCLYGCDNLASVHLPASLDSILNGFGSEMGALTELVIPRNVKFIDEYAFLNATGLHAVIFEEGSILKSIGLRAFDGTSLEQIDVPNSVTTMGGQVFGNCPLLRRAHLSDNLREMGGAMFWNCPSLVEGEVPGTVISTKNAFVYCPALKRVKFGDKNSVPGTTLVKNCSVSNSENVEYIEFGANVDSLEHLTIVDAENLKVVVCWAPTPPKCDSYWSSFNPSPANLHATLYVPQASFEAYCNAYDWRDFGIIACIEGVGDLNFSGGLDVTDITLLINTLLGEDPGEFAAYADVNLDGRIDVTDLTTLINLVLNAR